MTRQFTGRQMSAIMIGFFAVVIAVNLIMATSAVRTFGGVVVQNSYVAGQKFNGWIAEGRVQEQLGWRVQANGSADGSLIVSLAGSKGPLEGALVAVDAEHPLGQFEGRSFALKELGGGRYAAAHALPEGRWTLRIQARLGRTDARFVQEVRL